MHWRFLLAGSNWWRRKGKEGVCISSWRKTSLTVMETGLPRELIKELQTGVGRTQRKREENTMFWSDDYRHSEDSGMTRQRIRKNTYIISCYPKSKTHSYVDFWWQCFLLLSKTAHPVWRSTAHNQNSSGQLPVEPVSDRLILCPCPQLLHLCFPKTRLRELYPHPYAFYTCHLKNRRDRKSVV